MDEGNLDPMGVDESSLVDRIETNERISVLEVTVATYKMKYEHARLMALELGMTLRRLNNQGLAINHKQAETMLRAFEAWKLNGIHPHHPWAK